MSAYLRLADLKDRPLRPDEIRIPLRFVDVGVLDVIDGEPMYSCRVMDRDGKKHDVSLPASDLATVYEAVRYGSWVSVPVRLSIDV